MAVAKCEDSSKSRWVRVCEVSAYGRTYYVQICLAWAVFLSRVDAILPYANIIESAVYDDALRFLPRRLNTLGKQDLLQDYEELLKTPENKKLYLVADDGASVYRLDQPSIAAGSGNFHIEPASGNSTPLMQNVEDGLRLLLEDAVQNDRCNLITGLWEMAVLRATSKPCQTGIAIPSQQPEQSNSLVQEEQLPKSSGKNNSHIEPETFDQDRTRITQNDVLDKTFLEFEPEGFDFIPSEEITVDEKAGPSVERDMHSSKPLTHRRHGVVRHCVEHDIPIMLVGPAGSGKNHLVKQVANELGLHFYYANSVTDEFKITGFVDAGGTYRPTPFYEAFTSGGLFFLDEIDASAPEVLVCLNAAISNRYFSFPSGQVEAHPDFRVIAAGNTTGSGDAGIYAGRNRLDAASLDRFVVIEVDYDPRIDLLCAQNDVELVEFFHAFRAAYSFMSRPVVASYRGESQIKAMEGVLSDEEALRACLLPSTGIDEINKVVATKPMQRLLLRGSNRWINALLRLAGN